MSLSHIVEGLGPIHTSLDQLVHVYAFEGENSYNTPIVIKRIRCPDENSLQEARKEYEFIRNNYHPHICNCLDYQKEELSEGDYYVYIVMPKLVSSLDKEIGHRSSKPADESSTLSSYVEESVLWEYLRELVSAYVFLQRKHIAHRDIKPHNILIDASGALKVCDFGFAKRIELEKEAMHTLLGTMPYLSPVLRNNLIQGEKNLERVQHNVFKSDVYSLGICMMHLTMLDLPESVTSLKDLEININNFLSETNESINSLYSEKWINILRRMLTVQEEARPDFIQLEMELINPSEYADDELIKTQIFSMEMQDSVKFEMKFGLAYARVSNTLTEEIPCMISLEGLSQHSALRFTPFDIVCLIDLSGSMEYERLSLVQTALIQLIDKLGERDRVCLIGFSDKAQRLCPLIVCGKSGKATLREIINGLQIGDLTNIVAGLELAMEVIHQRRFKNASVSLLLFSDGKDSFYENAKDRCLEVLQRKAVDKLSVHCFGLGSEVDSDLLERIADQGKCSFIADLSSVKNVFDEAFVSLTSVVARNIRISVFPNPACELPCQVDTLYSKNRTDVFAISSLSATEKKTLMLFIKTPYTLFPNAKRFIPLQVEITYTDPEGVETPKELKESLKFVPWADAQPPQNPQVFANWYRAKGAQCLSEVRELIEQDPQGAVGRLERGIEELESTEYRELDIVSEMLEDLKRVWEVLRGKGMSSPENKIKFTSISYKYHSVALTESKRKTESTENYRTQG